MFPNTDLLVEKIIKDLNKQYNCVIKFDNMRRRVNDSVNVLVALNSVWREGGSIRYLEGVDINKEIDSNI